MLSRITKILSTLCCAFFLFSCHNENSIINLSKDQVYFFYQETCPHCHDAATYIKKTYPTAKIKAIDIKTPGNMKMFTEAANTYNVGSMAGTPLICFGKEYIMGWNSEEQARLDELIKEYLN